MELRRISCYLLATVALSVSIVPDRVIGQISSDSTLSTTVSTDDAVNFLIENGDRSGSNLFHSFSEFSIPNLGSAYFNNATDITNIFSRVTGGNISDIQGLIRANGTANLFLINPAGIVFGENASLNVGGSFFATTAESVVFGDGVEFSAIEPQEAPLLTINITPGLQMGANLGDIIINNTGHSFSTGFRQPITRNDTSPGLQVSNGNTLALVGGNIALNGGILIAENGTVELGAVSSADLVEINATELGFTLDYSEVSQFGDIQLIEQSLVEASEIGGIQAQGNNISVQDGSLFLIENQSNQSAQGIRIQATETIEFTGTNADISVGSGVISDVLGFGNSGDITLIAPQLRGIDGANLRAFTFGDGDSGNITLEVDEIDLIGGEIEDTVIEVRTLSAGNGGSLTINTQKLILQNASLINNVNGNGSGSAGSILINATELVEVGPNINQSTLIGSSAVSPRGNAGSITINTAKFTLEGGALISSSTFGAGNAGTITINATETIKVDGSGLNFFTTNAIQPTTIRTSGVFLSQAFRERFDLPDTVTGNAGEIILNTLLLQVTDGATISVRHEDVGDAGTLQVNADQVILQAGGSLTASTQSGDGGNIFLQVQESVELSDGGLIDTEAFGEGNGGNIVINSNILSLVDESDINANTVTGNGGNINLINEFLLLRNNSNITTNAGNLANGGNITMDTVNFVALEDSDITANAVFGRGGNIIITAQGLFLSPDSNITASSEFGIDGVVEINTPDEENKLAIAELSADLTDASQQIVGNCSWTRDNTFYVTGRSGIAKTPQEHIQDYTMWSDIRDLSSNQAEGRREKEERIIEANAWIINERGNVELVAVVPSNNQNLGQVASSCSGEVDS